MSEDYTPKEYLDDYHRVMRPARSLKQAPASNKVQGAWIVVGATVVCLVMFLLAASCAQAEVYSSEDIADAIWIIEGGDKSKKPYGILSVPCNDEAECRRVCLNTIENNFVRWQIAGSKGEFLDFLWNRYAPPSEHPLNKSWGPNLKKVLAQGGA